MGLKDRGNVINGKKTLTVGGENRPQFSLAGNVIVFKILSRG